MELSFATSCDLTQIAPSLQNKKRALHANLRLDLDKLAGPRHFQMPVIIVEKQSKMIRVIIPIICWAILLRFLKGLGLQDEESASFNPAKFEMMCR